MRVPTLILSGGADPIQARRVEEHGQPDIPHSKQVILEEAGHLLPEDQPQEIAGLILEFVSHA